MCKLALPDVNVFVSFNVCHCLRDCKGQHVWPSEKQVVCTLSQTCVHQPLPLLQTDNASATNVEMLTKATSAMGSIERSGFLGVGPANHVQKNLRGAKVQEDGLDGALFFWDLCHLSEMLGMQFGQSRTGDASKRWILDSWSRWTSLLQSLGIPVTHLVKARPRRQNDVQGNSTSNAKGSLP